MAILKFKSAALFCALLIASGCAFGGEDTKPSVVLTVLTLANGDTVKCVKMITATVNDQPIYTGTTLDGKRVEYSGDEVKSSATEEVEIASLSEAAQKTVAKYVTKKPVAIEAPAAPKKSADPAPATTANSTVTTVRIVGAVADERKKYDAAVEAIMEEGRKAVALQGQLDAAAKKIDAQAATLDAEIEAAQRGLNTPKQTPAAVAAWNSKLHAAQSRRDALTPQKTDADRAAADQDKLVADLVATKDTRLAKLKADFDAKCAQIKAKFEKEGTAPADVKP
jgi:small-conductance mechanosensitive channel